MPVSRKHIRHQLPVIASLGRSALGAAGQVLRPGAAGKGAPNTPGPLLEKTTAPLPADLIRDYVRAVGGDPRAYRGRVPAHLFPQWGFPLATRTLDGVPYPLLQVVNGGCRIEIHGDLPAGAPLEVNAQLVDIDDNGRRAILHQMICTGTRDEPELVVAHMYPIVVYRRGGGSGGRREAPHVPADAREIGFWSLKPHHAVDFARLTGDFNPIHWSPAYARMFGFRSTILHGFATMARALEGVQQSVYSGATSVRTFDARFTRPLTLPARVGLYVRDGEEGREVFVGDGPGGFAYMTGTFSSEAPTATSPTHTL